MSTLLESNRELATTTERIPTLDGWRGIAILLVLAEHFRPFESAQDLFGQHGVTIFFVLSGFLITTQLLAKQSRNGSLDLPTFYTRRFFRLMPCAWCYLGLLAFAGMGRTELLASVFFYRNEISGGLLTIHFWSLSMEEQFYLLWPIALLARRYAVWIAGAGAISVSAYRFMFWNHYLAYPLNFRTEVRADALFVGCLLALAWPHPLIHKIANRFMAPPLLLLFTGCVYRYNNLVPLFECVVIAMLITSGLADKSPLAPVLNLKPLRVLGTLSYSIYVWQQPFSLLIHHDLGRMPLLLFLPPIVVVSYYLIERPCTKFGHRITA